MVVEKIEILEVGLEKLVSVERILGGGRDFYRASSLRWKGNTVAEKNLEYYVICYLLEISTVFELNVIVLLKDV